MNTPTDTTAGTAVEPHGRNADAIRDSLIAVLLGSAASVGVIFVSALCFFGLRIASGIPAQQAIGIAIYVTALAYLWNAIGSLAGWLVFLLPLAMLHGRRSIADGMIPMCLAGAFVAVVLTGLESMPFSAWPFQLSDWIIVPFGVIDAVVATATLLYLRRRTSGQLKEGD